MFGEKSFETIGIIRVNYRIKDLGKQVQVRVKSRSTADMQRKVGIMHERGGGCGEGHQGEERDRQV